ncbi:MAG: hypothetical protein RMA76_12720 [Deltaproteobacteria bacterium]|jgi:hypothetical protein
MRLVLTALAASFAAASTAAAADAPLAFSQIGAETYTEQVSVMVDLDDGTYATATFGVSNVGPGDGKGACRFAVIDRSGKLHKGEVVVERDAWAYDAAKKSLKIGDCVATSAGGLTLSTKTPDGNVEIRLKKNPERKRAMEANVGDDFYQLDTLLLWSDAEVTLDVAGPKRTLKGHGYADHSRSKILPSTLAKKWLRFRAVGGDDPRVMVVRFPKSGSPVGWHEAGGFGRSTVSRAQVNRKGDRWRAMVKGDKGEWRLTTTKLLQRFAPIEDRGAILGGVIKGIVGNPVTYTFRGVLEERGTKKRIPGIVEITLTDE